MDLQEERDFLMHCRLGNLEEAKRYLESGGNPNVKDVAGRSAIVKAATHGRGKNLELVRLLIQFGADISEIENHPLVLKVIGGSKLSSKLAALKDRYAATLSELETAGFEFSTMDEEESQALKELNVPRTLIDFYRFAWPSSNPSDIGFHDVAGIEGNVEAMPADHLHPLGLVPVASDMSGANYCIDVNATSSLEEMPVYLFDVASYEGSTYPEVLASGEKIACSWIEFMKHVAASADD